MRVTNNNGGIRIQFWVDGTRYSLTPIKGGRYDSALDLALANEKAEQILRDIKTNQFDPTLDRYRSGIRKMAEAAKESSKRLEKLARVTAEVDLKTLWERYQQFKKPLVSPTTYKTDFVRRVGGAIAVMPTTNLRDAIAIRDWLLHHKTPKQARKILTQLNAAATWGSEVGLIESNPFEGLAKRIRVDVEGEITPFTASERDQIIEAFSGRGVYFHLVRFLFFSGCRPSEAIALRVSDRKRDKLTFRRSYVDGQLINRLKTQKSRTITLNEQLAPMVEEAIAAIVSPNPDGLLFPSAQGNFIDWHNFTNRTWRSVLAGLTDIEYRNPYQTRHTFITEALRAGADVADVAKHCGNSAKVIWQNYVGANRDFQMPEI